MIAKILLAYALSEYKDTFFHTKLSEIRSSAEVSRLGLGLGTCLETRFWSLGLGLEGLFSVWASKDFGLGLEIFVSRLCISYLL